MVSPSIDTERARSSSTIKQFISKTFNTQKEELLLASWFRLFLFQIHTNSLISSFLY